MRYDEPPYLAARYGKAQTFAIPTAEPTQAIMNPQRLPHWSRLSRPPKFLSFPKCTSPFAVYRAVAALLIQPR